MHALCKLAPAVRAGAGILVYSFSHCILWAGTCALCWHIWHTIPAHLSTAGSVPLSCVLRCQKYANCSAARMTGEVLRRNYLTNKEIGLFFKRMASNGIELVRTWAFLNGDQDPVTVNGTMSIQPQASPFFRILPQQSTGPSVGAPRARPLLLLYLLNDASSASPFCIIRLLGNA